MALKLIAVPFGEAQDFVTVKHRHKAAPRGHKFPIGCLRRGELVGVAIVGRPVAKGNQDGKTLEITRLASDGTRNVCSFLYGAARMSVFGNKYKRCITYTLKSESGVSLRAAGFVRVRDVRGGCWNRPSRPRDPQPIEDKVLWEAVA